MSAAVVVTLLWVLGWVVAAAVGSSLIGRRLRDVEGPYDWAADDELRDWLGAP